MPLSEIALKGAHNVENVLAAVAIGMAAGVEPAAIRRAVKDFRAVEHRLEYVATLRGVQYYNDSKATNVDATIKALESFPANIHLILGGKDKGSDYSELIPLIAERVKRVYTIGAAAAKIESQIGNMRLRSSARRRWSRPCARPPIWRWKAISCCWPRPAPASTSSPATSIAGASSRNWCNRWRLCSRLAGSGGR